MAEMRMIEAVRAAIAEEMERDDRVLVMGEDVGRKGGVFGATDGLYARFGEARVLDIETPPTQNVSPAQLTRCMDLRLARSGEQFPVENLVERARWRHFSDSDYPWERLGRI